MRVKAPEKNRWPFGTLLRLAISLGLVAGIVWSSSGGAKTVLSKKMEGTKKLLAMTIHSDTNSGFGLPLSTGLRRETTKNRCLYFDFERLFRPALRGHGLSFQRDSSKRSVYCQ